MENKKEVSWLAILSWLGYLAIIGAVIGALGVWMAQQIIAWVTRRYAAKFRRYDPAGLAEQLASEPADRAGTTGLEMPRPYNLTQTPLAQIVTRIIEEVVRHECSSGWYEDEPDQTEQLVETLAPFNIIQYMPGVWMQRNVVEVKRAQERFEREVVEAATKFTQKTGLAVESFTLASANGVSSRGGANGQSGIEKLVAQLTTGGTVGDQEGAFLERPETLTRFALPSGGTWLSRPGTLSNVANDKTDRLRTAECDKLATKLATAAEKLNRLTGHDVRQKFEVRPMLSVTDEGVVTGLAYQWLSVTQEPQPETAV